MLGFTDLPDISRELLEQSLDMLTVIDREGVVLYNSPALERVLGLRPEDLVGARVFGYIHPDDVPLAEQVIGRVLAGEVDVDKLEYRFRHKNGNYRWIASVARLWDQAGVQGLLVGSRDITELRETLDALERSNELLGKIFSASAQSLSITSPETGVFLDVNDTWCRTFGYSRDEVLGRSSLDLQIWGDPQQRAAVIAELEARGRLRGREAEVFTRHGQTRQLVIDAEILTVSGQRRYLLACTDVTEARRVEAELRQAQKMEALGQLTGGVAHDFNNLLGVILGNVELLALRFADQPEMERLVVPIMHACERGGSLTRQLLAFARRQALAPESVHLGAHIRRLQPILATSLSAGTEIRVDVAPDLWPCSVDPGQFENALLNLVLNARDAMPEGGELGIRVENRSALDEGNDLRVGDYVAVTVSDTGTGIEPELTSQVFEPFFTTKDPGQGTGLGLSMVFGFAKQSGGDVELSSERGRGTAVTLLLPRGEDRQEDAGDPAIAVPQARGESILLVEDNDALRVLLADQLRGLGYAVFEAGDERAVDGVLGSGARIDLVVSDLDLGGRQRGPDVVANVRAARPGVAALFMSGHIVAEELADELPLIRKPFGRADFAQAVLGALGRQSRSGRSAARFS